MPSSTLGRRRRDLAPLTVATAASLLFAVLLVLVRLRWPPLESADHGAAASINALAAGHTTLVAVVKAVTWLGSDGVLWTVVGVAAIVMALRRRWRLAIYLLVTGAGAIVLDPVLKSLVGRLRPAVAHPIAHGTGNSFPSGHTLGSIVCYGAVLLVFLPAARGRWRIAFITVIVALVTLIGISRILLGSLLFSALWLTAATVLIRPNVDGRTGAAPGARGVRPQLTAEAAVPASAARGAERRH
jgi:undecaprenyl-diphosphatase